MDYSPYDQSDLAAQQRRDLSRSPPPPQVLLNSSASGTRHPNLSLGQTHTVCLRRTTGHINRVAVVLDMAAAMARVVTVARVAVIRVTGADADCKRLEDSKIGSMMKNLLHAWRHEWG